jgi:hypothetical protein
MTLRQALTSFGHHERFEGKSFSAARPGGRVGSFAGMVRGEDARADRALGLEDGNQARHLEPARVLLGDHPQARPAGEGHGTDDEHQRPINTRRTSRLEHQITSARNGSCQLGVQHALVERIAHLQAAGGRVVAVAA